MVIFTAEFCANPTGNYWLLISNVCYQRHCPDQNPEGFDSAKKGRLSPEQANDNNRREAALLIDLFLVAAPHRTAISKL